MRNIEFLRITFLRGPNVWTYRPVLEALVDIGDLEDCPSNTIPGFHERLSAWLPSLIEHECSVGERGGFLQRVREGTWPAHIMEHVALELQTLAGQRTGFGRARGAGRPGIYKVVVRCRQEEVSRACLIAARDLVMAAIDDQPFDVPATIRRLRAIADDHCLGPSTACIADAAAERGIPWLRLTDGNLVQFGYGQRSRRIWTAETDRTSAIGESIAGDKDLTKRLLAACGVPVPEGREVTSAEDAWDAAQDIGLPVVVKPTDANHGRGVFTHLSNPDEIAKAFAVARDEGSGVMVERFIPGSAHRLLVVGNRVVAASRGKVLSVIGDGASTIAELVESQINSDPRCGVEEEFPLEPLILAREPIAMLELERQGLTPQSVPPAGAEILLKRQGDLAYDETDDVHADVAGAVTLAARVVGLDIAGIDLVAADISRPLAEQGGAVLEVNAGPGLLMHLKPAEGKPRPVGKAIVDHLFAAGDTGRIPLVGITGTSGTTLAARLVAYLLTMSGKYVGLACRNGLFVDRRPIDNGDGCRWQAAHRLLLNRSVAAAVFESGAANILDEGLPYDRCQIGVVTSIGAVNGLADRGIHDAGQLAHVLRTQVDVVLADGAAVLNAGDALVAAMGDLCDGDVVYFASSADAPPLADHCRRGKRAVLVRDGRVVLAGGNQETSLLSLAGLPALANDSAGDQLDGVLAATAAAWALGIAPELIRAGLATFDSGGAAARTAAGG